MHAAYAPSALAFSASRRWWGESNRPSWPRHSIAPSHGVAAAAAIRSGGFVFDGARAFKPRHARSFKRARDKRRFPPPAEAYADGEDDIECGCSPLQAPLSFRRSESDCVLHRGCVAGGEIKWREDGEARSRGRRPAQSGFSLLEVSQTLLGAACAVYLRGLPSV